MTAEMRPWYPASTGARTGHRRTGGPRRAPSQYGAVRGVDAAGRTLMASGRGSWGRASLGRRAALGGVQRATSRRGGVRASKVLMALCSKLNNSKILYKSAPNVEYESCRSQTHLQLSQRLYGVFLIGFFSASLSTLNTTPLQ
jgi:hypothetical protein